MLGNSFCEFGPVSTYQRFSPLFDPKVHLYENSLPKIPAQLPWLLGVTLRLISQNHYLGFPHYLHYSSLHLNGFGGIICQHCKLFCLELLCLFVHLCVSEYIHQAYPDHQKNRIALRNTFR